MMRSIGLVTCLLIAAALIGCARNPTSAVTRTPILSVKLNDTVAPLAEDGSIEIAGARNEWISFSVQVSRDARDGKHSLRIRPPKSNESDETLGADLFSAEQILPIPVDANRAGFVRHTGLRAGDRALPRALLPMPMKNGDLNLARTRDVGVSRWVMLWIDLRIPADAPPGEYVSSCDIVAADSRSPVGLLPIKITIHDFKLPDERHLVMTSRLRWDDLARLYPDQFETIRPRLLNRDEPSSAAPIATLDALMALAQRHRTELTIPRLQPTVKWTGADPQIDWSDIDTVISPWLSGAAFADRIALEHWPLPAPDQLDRYDRKSQAQYWTAAAEHFAQKNWLGRCPIVLESPLPGRVGAALSIQLSADAADVLKTLPQARVMLPLEQDQIQLADKEHENFIAPAMTDRLFAVAPGIVFNSPMQRWPPEVKRPRQWLRTDVPGLVPYVGAGGDERDVRVWAWQAFRSDATLVQFDSPLPRTNSPIESADPNDLIWFYPGHWFGVDQPVATVQLKWLRRAQQDYEYLWLARERGAVVNAMLMARLMTKPVEVQPGQAADPTYALMTGTADPDVWAEAQSLLARIILAGDDASDLDVEILRWSRPQERALLVARSANWGFEPGGDQSISLKLGLDIYNASDTKPDQNRLQWTMIPRGLRVSPAPVTLPALSTYHVTRFTTQARFDGNAIDVKDRSPAELTFTNRYLNVDSKLNFVLPVAPTDRLGPSLNPYDGDLSDWHPADAIQAGPLVRMLDRPSLQKQEVRFADEPALVYTGWADQNFYVAFKLLGASPANVKQTRNFIDYAFRRAWGEDLCEILIQPIFDDNTLGPVLHVVCKPTGTWVERKLDPRAYADPWQPLEGVGIKYAARSDEAWTGEVAIPWRAITGSGKGLPKLLRFNFVQHVHSTGQSASWAGPIDFGRDEDFMGLLYVRESTDPGVVNSSGR